MSRPVSYTSAATVNIASFSGSTNLTVGTGTSAATYAVNSSANTTNFAAFSSTTRNSSGYAYYKFDVSEIPSIASITSVSCTFRAACRYSSGTGRTDVQLMAGTTLKGSAQNVNATGRSGSSAITISDTGTWTRSELDNIALRIYSVKTTNSNSSHGTRFYGATLTVNYSVNSTEYEVSFNNQSSEVTTEPSTTQEVFQGGSQEITFYGVDNLNNVEIKDNGNDIKNSLVTHPTGTFSETLNPAVYEGGNGTVTNENNALTDTASTTYAQLLLRQNVYMIYGFDVNIPENATINSVSCSAKYNRSATSSSITNLTIQMYSDTTAKGNAYTITSTSTAVSTANLTVGTWTVSELKKAKIRLSGNYTGSNNYYFNFYGANLTINYTINEVYYTYTISNISADHVISIQDVQTGTVMKMKQNGSWVTVNKVYKKVNGSWTEQSDLTNVFTNGNIYFNN